jgi:roadblock/LC7 domain-containing protein
MVVDGRAGSPYDEIGPPVFSPDGKHVAYTAVRARVGLGLPPFREEQLVVADGQEGQVYDGIGDGTPVFTPDGRLVYKAYVGEKLGVVVDGVRGRLYDDLASGPPVVSPDGRHVAYAARVAGKSLLILDGAESPAYDAVGEGTPVFSPDGTRVAYDARLGTKWAVVADGSEWPQRYDATLRDTPLFSPDGRHVISAVQRGGAEIVVDGQAGQAYNAVIPGTAKIVFDSATSFHYLAIRGTRWYVVEETLN